MSTDHGPYSNYPLVPLPPQVVPVNVISDRDNYAWKGHQALSVHEGDVTFAAGFQPSTVMQLAPPAAITALDLNAEWQLYVSQY
jgi:lethal(2) giant larvae protein